MSLQTIIVLAGSVRATRRSPRVAAWVAALGREATGLAFDVADPIELGLRLGDEPALPAKGLYAAPTTQAWSDRVAASAGIVFVTPQYNWGYPAPVKNAIDHLYREWADKPAAIVTYGGHGGGKCAAQLAEVLDGLHMRRAATMPAMRLSRERIEADDGEIEPETDFAAYKDQVIAALRELAALVAEPRPT